MYLELTLSLKSSHLLFAVFTVIISYITRETMKDS